MGLEVYGLGFRVLFWDVPPHPLLSSLLRTVRFRGKRPRFYGLELGASKFGVWGVVWVVLADVWPCLEQRTGPRKNAASCCKPYTLNPKPYVLAWSLRGPLFPLHTVSHGSVVG